MTVLAIALVLAIGGALVLGQLAADRRRPRANAPAEVDSAAETRRRASEAPAAGADPVITEGAGPVEPGGARKPAVRRRLVLLAGVLFVAFVLAVFLVPKFDTNDMTYVATMRADLRALEDSEEGFFADSVRYAGSIAELGFVASAGDSVTIVEASESGWSAVARSAGTSRTCGMFVGRAKPAVRGQAEAVPACE